VELSADTRREIAELAHRYGEPRVIDAMIDDGFDDPIRRRDRYGEVLMAVRRPSGKLLLAIKTFYPRGAYRLPTGGIHHGESIHDALLRPLPGQKMGNSLAESWKESPDGLTYEFKLRRGLKFHNGDPLTAEDVKFSFERYKGAGAKAFQERVQQVEIVDPLTVRFQLKEPWPDFLTFYGTSATAAGIVVPKKYMTQVGDDGFKKHPIGAGPYKFVSHKPGVEVVLEANPGYWRHVPHVKRLTMKSVPEGTTRVAMLKNGEADIAYALDGEDALNVRRDPRLQLVPSKHASIYWIEFAEQWDPKSPWHDKRMRLAVNYALNRQSINEASCLGFCPPAGVIVPRVMEFALQAPVTPYDPQKAKQLLAEAGYPNGFDAGDFYPWPPYTSMGEALASYLQAVGIRSRIRTMERATLTTAWREKKLKGVIVGITGAGGNAATRLEAYVSKEGVYTAGVIPEVEDLFQRQARETDVKRREALIHQIQQILHDRVTHIPIYELAFTWGIGPRLEEPGISLIRGYAYSAPYEDLKLKRP